MKYVMLDIPFGAGVRRTPILFPDYLTHAVVVEALQQHELLSDATVHSAGEFSSMALHNIEMHGRSVSLGVDSDPADSELMLMLDYTHGII